MCTYQREKKSFFVTPAHQHTNKMTSMISLPWRLAQKTEEWKCTLFSWSNIESVRHSLWLTSQHPRCRGKKAQHNGKTHGKPICSTSAKNNLCQVHQRAGLERSSHFIMEVGSSRVGLPVNTVSRSAFTGSHLNENLTSFKGQVWNHKAKLQYNGLLIGTEIDSIGHHFQKSLKRLT